MAGEARAEGFGGLLFADEVQLAEDLLERLGDAEVDYLLLPVVEEVGLPEVERVQDRHRAGAGDSVGRGAVVERVLGVPLVRLAVDGEQQTGGERADNGVGQQDGEVRAGVVGAANHGFLEAPAEVAVGLGQLGADTADLGVSIVFADALGQGGEGPGAGVGPHLDGPADDGKPDAVAGDFPPNACGLSLQAGVGPGGGEVDALFEVFEVFDAGAEAQKVEGLAGGLAGELGATAAEREEDLRGLFGLLGPQGEGAQGGRTAAARVLLYHVEVLFAERVDVAEVVEKAVELGQETGAEEGAAAKGLPFGTRIVGGGIDGAERSGGEQERSTDVFGPRSYRPGDPGDVGGVAWARGLEPLDDGLMLRSLQRAAGGAGEVGAKEREQAEDQRRDFAQPLDERLGLRVDLGSPAH